jgi:hypothetical protein
MHRGGTGVMDSRQHVPSAPDARPRRRSRRPRPVRRIPAPGQPGNNLRRTARLLSTLPSVADVPLAETTLLMRFARLAEAIAELRKPSASPRRPLRPAGRPNICGPPCLATSPRHRAGAPGSAPPPLSAAELSSRSHLAPSGPEPARWARQTVSTEPGQFPGKDHRTHGARRGNWSGRFNRGRRLRPSRLR